MRKTVSALRWAVCALRTAMAMVKLLDSNTIVLIAPKRTFSARLPASNAAR